MRIFVLSVLTGLFLMSCEKEIEYWNKDYIIVGDPSQVGLMYASTTFNIVLYDDQTIDLPIDLNLDNEDDLIFSKNTGHTKISSFLTIDVSGSHFILCDDYNNALVFSPGDTLKSDRYNRSTYANIFKESHGNCESPQGCSVSKQGYWEDKENKCIGIVSEEGKLGWVRMSLKDRLVIRDHGILR